MPVPITWSDRRLDVLAALDTLAAAPPALRDGRDPRWPDLTNAVHWLVDDTWWDQRAPSEDIGLLLRDEDEAAAVAAVVQAVVRVSERAGPTDAAWFADDEWPLVRTLA